MRGLMPGSGRFLEEGHGKLHLVFLPRSLWTEELQEATVHWPKKELDTTGSDLACACSFASSSWESWVTLILCPNFPLVNRVPP